MLESIDNLINKVGIYYRLYDGGKINLFATPDEDLPSFALLKLYYEKMDGDGAVLKNVVGAITEPVSSTLVEGMTMRGEYVDPNSKNVYQIWVNDEELENVTIHVPTHLSVKYHNTNLPSDTSKDKLNKRTLD